MKKTTSKIGKVTKSWTWDGLSPFSCCLKVIVSSIPSPSFCQLEGYRTRFVAKRQEFFGKTCSEIGMVNGCSG